MVRDLAVGILVLATISVGELSSIVIASPPRNDHTQRQTALVATALDLTDPTDYVMDTKGEMLFRQRASYYVLESLTNYRMGRGLIADDIPERLLATKTCVAALDSRRFPQRARAFLNANYISIGVLRVAGHLLPVNPASNAIRFNVEIPARYGIVSMKDASVAGVLDGSTYEGPRFLERGSHEFLPDSTANRLAFVWARAIEHGYSPFVESQQQSKDEE